MPFDLQITERALDVIEKVGGPIAYTMFTVMLFAWLLRSERARADKAEQRNAELQERLLKLATAQTEATMKAAVALSNVTDSKDEKP